MRSFLSMPKHFSKYDFCISKLFLASSIVKNDRMKWFVIEFSEILCYILWFFTREFQDGDYSLRFVIWQFFILQSWSGVCRVFEFFIDSREKIIPFSSQFIPLFFWLDFRDFFPVLSRMKENSTLWKSKPWWAQESLIGFSE